MKTPIFAVPILFMACTFSGPILQPELRELSESWDTWKSLKSKNGSTYSYSVRHGSVFGFWSEYEFSIRNDSMKTILVSTGNVDPPDTTTLLKVFDTLSNWEKEWYKTIDEQYEYCLNSVLTVDKFKNNISELQFLRNGVLKSCTYYPHDCQDDCMRGSRIDSVWF